MKSVDPQFIFFSNGFLMLVKHLLLLLLVGCQTLTPSISLNESSTFDFHSGVWINLHHYLYNEAFSSKSHKEPNFSFDSDEKIKIQGAISFYQSHFKNRDLLFDKNLKEINDELATAENGKNLNNFKVESLKTENNLLEILEEVKPIYVKHLWSLQNKKNLQWISKVKEKLKLFESPIKQRLEKVLNTQFSNIPYRIDVVHHANWAGAYTSRSPAHTTISSGRSSYDDYASLEMIFHEIVHTGLFDGISEKIDTQFSSHHMSDKDQIWHAIHFYTVGEITREVLASYGIEYTPYAYKNSLFSVDRKWGEFEPLLRKYWLFYLKGEMSLDESIKSIVNSIVNKTVDYRTHFLDQSFSNFKVNELKKSVGLNSIEEYKKGFKDICH